jgi:hypothetical protein
MPYKRSVILKFEGDELLEFKRAWRERWGLTLLTSRVAELMARGEEHWDETWRGVRERHCLEDDVALLFDAATGELYRREWVQEPTEGDHERDETEQ